MVLLLDLTVISDSNVIRSVLRNAADTISIISDWPPRQIKEPNTRGIKEPNTRGIKEPNLDGTNTNAYKRYKSYKRLILFV